LTAAISTYVDQQSGTNFHRICKADTREQFECRLKGWLFECTYAGDVSDRRLTEGVPYQWT